MFFIIILFFFQVFQCLVVWHFVAKVSVYELDDVIFFPPDWYVSPGLTLYSRNFQNVKWRLDFVEIGSFYRHSDFVWNQILANSNSQKMSFWAIWKVLNFDFSKFEQHSSPKFTKIQNSESLKLPKVTFLHCLNSPKFDFM